MGTKERSESVTSELSDIAESSLMQNITYISHNSYLFKGTIRENLPMEIQMPQRMKYGQFWNRPIWQPF
ncbi:MAG: hypothetical protein ACLTTO_15215 [Lachnospiraceae bacterium]